MAQTVLIAGGTGLIGSALCEKLNSNGFNIHLLSRKQDTKYPSTLWDPQKDYYDANTLPDVNIIINLAGTGIADKRWTTNRKKEIIDSRVDSNRLIQRIITNQKTPVNLYISASAIGIYGDRGDELLYETSVKGDEGFLVETVKAWEKAIDKVSGPGLRKITFRFGIVLTMKGGALPKMVNPLKFFIAPYFGTGKQIVSWIHIEDQTELFLFSIKNNGIDGIYNAASPAPVSNKYMTACILKQKNSLGILLSIPVFVLKIMLGEMADVILSSNRVSPEKLISTGFKFSFPVIETALKDIFTNKQ